MGLGPRFRWRQYGRGFRRFRRYGRIEAVLEGGDWRRRADSNRRIEVLQTSALTTWLRRPVFEVLFGPLVPRAGFEPAQANAHGPLKTACLPIPPPRPRGATDIIACTGSTDTPSSPVSRRRLPLCYNGVR